VFSSIYLHCPRITRHGQDNHKEKNKVKEKVIQTKIFMRHHQAGKKKYTEGVPEEEKGRDNLKE
jgi:hypothetical protein